MNPKLTSQDEIQLKVLRVLQEQPDLSQRNLAAKLGVSLGSINYCLKALVAKGWVKMENFGHSSHKLGYIYLLTPEGIVKKSKLIKSFLRIKLAEYRQLENEISKLESEANN